MATIVHFDIAAEDMDRAKQFYEQLFGWKFRPTPMNYYMITTEGLDGKPGIGGGMSKRESGRQPGINNFIGVRSVAQALQQVQQLGGKVLMPAQPVPGYGILALCADTEHNVFGVFEEASL